ncbi:ADP-ribosylation factor-like protein 4C [Saccostrea cucullata]|uniref:ADP-ribosylation factor-like protein 4C n=1 Tax=Saccostrea cuccullata TaxID=36930 RepID=UPI002ED40DB4
MGNSSSVQISMLGLDSSGKTTILYRMKFQQYTNATPTISYNCETIKVKEGRAKGITFKIWDVGGQDNKRPLWNQYTRSSDGIIFVVDSVDRERLEEAKLELIRLLKNADNQRLPLLVIANKQDLPNSLDLCEIEKLLGLRDLHPGQVWAIQGACAITGEGLPEAMDTMFDLIVKKKSLKKRK